MGVSRMMAGFRAKFDIAVEDANGVTLGAFVAYSVRRWEISGEAPELPVPNTEGFAGHLLGVDGEGFMASLTGLRSLKLTLEECTYSTTRNIFGTPQTINEGNFISVKFFPAGRAGGKQITLSGLKVTRKRLSGEADGLQPVTIEASSDGVYTFS